MIRSILAFLQNHKIFSIGLVVLLMVLLVASRYGFAEIELDLSTAGNEKYSFVLLEQSTKQQTKVETSSLSVKKLVKKGDYEVWVNGQKESYFSVKKVGGFLRTTKTIAKLEKKNSNKFVGYGPESCADYNEVVAVSWACQGDAGTFAVHKPPVGSQATFKDINPYTLSGKPKVIENEADQYLDTEETEETPPDELSGEIEGIFKSGGKNVVLLREVSHYSPPQHVIYNLDDQYRPKKKQKINGLDGNKLYTVSEIDGGFVVSNIADQIILRYSSLDSDPVQISISDYLEDGLELRGVKTYKDKVIVSLTDYVIDVETEALKGVKNKYLVVGPESQYTIELNDLPVYQFDMCGDRYLCVVDDGDLLVYKINDKNEPKYSYKILDVKGVEAVGESIIVAKDNGSIALDVDGKNGYYNYISDKLTSCGILDKNKDGYIVCVNDQDRRRALLDINLDDNEGAHMNDVVKYVEDLGYVKIVSSYGDSVIVSLDLGEVVRDEDTGEFGYDKSRVKSLSDQLDQAMNYAPDKDKIKLEVIGVN